MTRKSTIDKPLTRKERKDLRILALFTSVYCRAHHRPVEILEVAKGDVLERCRLDRFRLCRECGDFLRYAVTRRIDCPLEPKPSCKHCEVHCYRAGHREKVREIMRFSGQKLIRSGRLDLLWHYLF